MQHNFILIETILLLSIIRENINRLTPFSIAITICYICIRLLYYYLNTPKKRLLNLILIGFLIILNQHWLYALYLLPLNILFLIPHVGIASLISLALTPLNESIALYIPVCLSICFHYYLTYKNSQEMLMQKQILYKNESDINGLEKQISQLKTAQSELVYVTKLEERNQIAQQLHDQIGHNITGAIMQLEAIKILMEQEPEKAQQYLEKVILSMREGMDNIRLTLKSIKPNYDYILTQNLLAMVDQIKAEHKIDIQIHHIEVFQHLPLVYQKLFYDNIQESITNIFKHSNASQVDITFEILNKLIKLVISDNGISTQEIQKGMGLRGMEERILQHNGQLLIDQSFGFRLTMLLPIKEDYAND